MKTICQKLERGNAWIGILILLVFLTTIGLALVSNAVLSIVQSKRAAQILVAQALGDAGVEKAIWMLNKTNGNYIGESDLDLKTGTIDIEISNINNENKNILVTAYVPDKAQAKVTRKIRARATAQKNNGSFSFHYGIQVGETGIEMSNNSQVVGSVYSGGDIEGANGAMIKGDVYISKLGGKIEDLKVGCSASGGDGCPVDGNAHADNITNCYIYGDAYYKNITSTTVLGNSYPNSETPETIGLPISDSTLDNWKSWAAAGGTHSGNLILDENGATLDLGPQKIEGDMVITNGSTLNLTGVIWVTGDVEFSNNAIVRLDSSFGPQSSMIIADGQITTSNNVTFLGSGNESSYIMILSTSTTDPAIDVSNNSSSVVYYAQNGFINVSNNAYIRSITAKGVRLKNGAIVEYDTGLASSEFSAGPGGSWVITEWQIVHT